MKRLTTYGILIMAAVIIGESIRIDTLSHERDRYRENQRTLIGRVEQYKTKDSLSAAKVGALELTLKEWKQAREQDAALIKTLQTRKRDVSQVASTATASTLDILTPVYDTLLQHDTLYLPARCFDYADEWVDVHGCFSGEEFAGIFTLRDSLTLVETVKRKRFLGFLWKTGKVKNRQWDIVSKNPYTEVQHIEVIRISR